MKSQSEGRGIWEWDIVKCVIGISILFFIAIILFYGWTEEGLRHEIRWTGRIGFFLFCLAFGATGIHKMMKRSLSWWLLMNRKYIGISFALIHLIHLGFVISLQLFFHPVFDRAASISLFGGGVAYFFVVTMLLTSFGYFSQRMSKAFWRGLHTVGGYWIWAIFLSTYFKRLDEPIHWIFVVVLVTVLFLRANVLISRYR